jgi:hypothetical protein
VEKIQVAYNNCQNVPQVFEPEHNSGRLVSRRAKASATSTKEKTKRVNTLTTNAQFCDPCLEVGKSNRLSEILELCPTFERKRHGEETAVVENGAGGGDGGGHGKGLKRKKMVSVEEISPEFVCPCCMTFFHGSIYLCRWGHSICNACYWTMKRPRVCPKSKKCKGFPR